MDTKYIFLTCRLSLESLHGYKQQLGVSALHRLQEFGNTKNSLGATYPNFKVICDIITTPNVEVGKYSGGALVRTLGKGSLDKDPGKIQLL